MKSRFILTLILLCCMYSVFAQQTGKIKELAGIMASAAVKGDYATVAEFTYPQFVAAMGGTDSLIYTSRQAMAGLKESGVYLRNAEIGEPGAIITIGDKEFSVVSQTIYLNRGGTIFKATSSLLAISLDKGQKWYFISVSNNDDKVLKKFFPELVGKITIPPATSAEPVTNQN